MYYPDSIIEEVRHGNDIVDVIGSYVKLTKRGSNHQGLCPFHNEKTPSFSVNRQRQIFKCFGCGKSGNVITFVMEYENMDFQDAVKLLADRAGVSLPKAETQTEEARRRASLRESLFGLYKTAAIYYHKTLRSDRGAEGYEYLKGRSLSNETIVKFGLGYSPKANSELYGILKEKGFSDEVIKESELFRYDERNGARDKFWNRVMFPIMDINGRVIAFGGRVMGDGIPKYLNSNETKIFEKSKNLYAMNIARRTRRDCFLLCEGYMDVIALHQAGFDNAVASLGTSLTSQQAGLLSRYSKSVIITYDSDGAGVKAALRAIPILKNVGITVKVLKMTPYKDPDEFIKALGQEEYQKRIDEAQPAFYFELDCMESAYDMGNPEEKTKFFNELAVKMLEFPDELERTNYCEAAAKRYGIPYGEFRKLVNKKALTKEASTWTNEPEPSVFRQEQKKNIKLSLDRNLFEAEKMILTWGMEEKKYSDVIAACLTEEDFQEGVPRKAAGGVFKQIDSEGKIDPAPLISLFEDTEEQSVASDLFQDENWNRIKDSKVRDRAFSDAMKRILENSNKRRMNEASQRGDNNTVMECIKAKKQISEQVKKILNRLAGE